MEAQPASHRFGVLRLEFPRNVPALETTTALSGEGPDRLGLCRSHLYFFVPQRIPQRPTSIRSCYQLRQQLRKSGHRHRHVRDDSHQLPAQLDQLVAGRYLKTIPTCPAAGRVTYRYEKFQTEWTINCQGDYHHTGTHPDEMGNVTLEVNYPIIGSSCPLRLNSLENSPPPWRRNK